MSTFLSNVYGTLLITRPPAPVTMNKAGANYKSEVPHLQYSPKRAFDEWTNICDAIVKCGGDAIFALEEEDSAFLGHSHLQVDGDGNIFPKASTEVLGNIADVFTGRVFTANGPWLRVTGKSITAVMQHMLPHRLGEAVYYKSLLREIASAGDYSLSLIDNPYRWEGMADVAVVGDKVVLTHAVPGHYDEGTSPKSSRSSLDGLKFVATEMGLSDECLYAELVYPHFHGDTVHYGLRPKDSAPLLAHYSGGLWQNESAKLTSALGVDRILPISQDDAVEQYAGNSRQVGDGVLIPDSVSEEYEKALNDLGLKTLRVPLFELFGKAGGGPGCATLYLPDNLDLPQDFHRRYTQSQSVVKERRELLAESVEVAPEFFEGKSRG